VKEKEETKEKEIGVDETFEELEAYVQRLGPNATNEVDEDSDSELFEELSKDLKKPGNEATAGSGASVESTVTKPKKTRPPKSTTKNTHDAAAASAANRANAVDLGDDAVAAIADLGLSSSSKKDIEMSDEAEAELLAQLNPPTKPAAAIPTDPSDELP